MGIGLGTVASDTAGLIKFRSIVDCNRLNSSELVHVVIAPLSYHWQRPQAREPSHAKDPQSYQNPTVCATVRLGQTVPLGGLGFTGFCSVDEEQVVMVQQRRLRFAASSWLALRGSYKVGDHVHHTPVVHVTGQGRYPGSRYRPLHRRTSRSALIKMRKKTPRRLSLCKTCEKLSQSCAGLYRSAAVHPQTEGLPAVISSSNLLISAQVCNFL